MATNTLLEVCCDRVDSAIAAEEGGADRIELCSGLVDGGVTPSLGTILICVRKLRIPVHVLIRPRPGDFCYSDDEFESILLDISSCRRAGVRCASVSILSVSLSRLTRAFTRGIVTGVLTRDGEVDEKRMEQIIEAAGTMK